MVAGQMLTGMPRETADVVTWLLLAIVFICICWFSGRVPQRRDWFFQEAGPQVDDGNK